MRPTRPGLGSHRVLGSLPRRSLGRASLLVDRGRLADAERLLNQALRDPRIDGFDLRRFLAPLYGNEGRVEEARRLIEANWEGLNRAGRGDSERAIELVRLHVAVSLGTSSAEAVREFLDRAQRLCPNDDRVWLGRANLAIRQGELRRGGAVARRLPEAQPRGRPGLAGAAGLGRGDRSGRGGPRGPRAPAGRGVDPGPGSPAGGLVRRASCGCRIGAPGAWNG